MAESMVSELGFLSGCNWRITSTSRLFNESRSDCEIVTFVGQAGREGSTTTPEDGEDSASKRACKTAESLDVNDGRNAVADVMAMGYDGHELGMDEYARRQSVKLGRVKSLVLECQDFGREKDKEWKESCG